MPARRPKPLPGEKKSDTTRRVLLERALALFQKRGVEATTMRDIAKAAGMSLGAAYYYFSSKEALLFAYYEDNQREMDRVELPAGNVREQVGALFHAKLHSLAPHKKMLASIVQRLIDPAEEISAFSQQSASVRDNAIAVISRALESSTLPADLRSLAARALWLMQMAVLLVFVRDTTPGEKNSHRFVDDALDMVIPMLPLLATPMGSQLAKKIVDALARAGIVDAV